MEKIVHTLGLTSTEITADALNELSGNGVSNLLNTNMSALMSAIGVSKEDSSFDLFNSLNDKLKDGNKIKVNLSDGSILSIGGGYSEKRGRWDFDFEIEFPSSGTKSIFRNNSVYTIKGGNLKVTSDTGEVLKDPTYGAIIGLYTYKFDLTGATIYNGAESFNLDIKGLSVTEEGFDYVLMIDPDRTNWTITIREFTFPDENAPGTVKLNGQTVAWKDVKKLLK